MRKKEDPANLVMVESLERRLMFESHTHTKKSDSNEYNKDGNNEIHMKMWPVEHIPKICCIDFVCLHPTLKKDFIYLY